MSHTRCNSLFVHVCIFSKQRNSMLTVIIHIETILEQWFTSQPAGGLDSGWTRRLTPCCTCCKLLCHRLKLGLTLDYISECAALTSPNVSKLKQCPFWFRFGCCKLVLRFVQKPAVDLWIIQLVASNLVVSVVKYWLVNLYSKQSSFNKLWQNCQFSYSHRFVQL